MNAVDIQSKLKTDAKTLRQLGVASLKLFGSSARNEAVSTSDVDFLVRFQSAPSYDRFMDLKFHLEDLLGVKIDLVTDDALRPEMRDAIEKDALVVA